MCLIAVAPSPSPSQKDILLLTGGIGSKGQHSSVEVYPSTTDCTVPPLPSTRYGHQTFVTLDPTPIVATCGGYIPHTMESSCLVLDLINQRWDAGIMKNLTMPRAYGAVAQLNIGVFFLGGNGAGITSSDFLPAGTLQWQQGPPLPESMVQLCAVPITPTSFLTIFNGKIHEFDAAIAGPTSYGGWRETQRWETLKTVRLNKPGCAKIGNKVIIAGGTLLGKDIQSTEVLDITTRTTVNGGDMASPRRHFNLAKISSEEQDKLFAIGGLISADSLNYLITVEEWVMESFSWKEAKNLTVERQLYGVVALPKELICLTSTTPAPTTQVPTTEAATTTANNCPLKGSEWNEWSNCTVGCQEGSTGATYRFREVFAGTDTNCSKEIKVEAEACNGCEPTTTPSTGRSVNLLNLKLKSGKRGVAKKCG